MNQLTPASEAQKKLFFALCTELGYDQDKLKERAKELYNLTSFADISSLQISALIDKLQHEKHFSAPEPKHQTKPELNEKYRFGIFVVASTFNPIAKIFNEISEGMSSMMGESVAIDADIHMGTITVSADKKLTPEQIAKVASIIQTDFAERFKLATIKIKPL